MNQVQEQTSRAGTAESSIAAGLASGAITIHDKQSLISADSTRQQILNDAMKSWRTRQEKRLAAGQRGALLEEEIVERAKFMKNVLAKPALHQQALREARAKRTETSNHIRETANKEGIQFLHLRLCAGKVPTIEGLEYLSRTQLMELVVRKVILHALDYQQLSTVNEANDEDMVILPYGGATIAYRLQVANNGRLSVEYSVSRCNSSLTFEEDSDRLKADNFDCLVGRQASIERLLAGKYVSHSNIPHYPLSGIAGEMLVQQWAKDHGPALKAEKEAAALQQANNIGVRIEKD